MSVLKNIDLFKIERELTEEQRMIRDTVRKFAREQILPHIRKWDAEEQPIPKEILLDFVKITGIVGACFPEGTVFGDYEFPAIDYISKGLIMQELEYIDSGLRSIFSVQNSLVMMPIYWYGSKEQKNYWLPKLARFEALGAYGQTETEAGSDPASMATTARQDGDWWILNGMKAWISNGSIADVIIVWARVKEKTFAAFLVEKNTPGFTALKNERKWSLRTSVTSQLVFENCRVPKENILSGSLCEKNLQTAFKCLNEARYGIAWGALGAAMACYDEVAPFITLREQFGKPIGSFGKQRVRIARVAQEITNMQLQCLYLGKLANANQGLDSIGAIISEAKGHNTTKTLEIALESSLMLGGNLCTFEFHSPRHLRNMLSVWTYEGTGDIHEKILSQYLTGLPAFTRPPK